MRPAGRGRARGLRAALLLGLAPLLVPAARGRAEEPIRIGVLHSLTGTMATSEWPLVDAVRLAVEEVNAGGGLLGRRVEAVVADTRSDPARAALEAERLLREEKVQVLFGCWTSACRKAVVPVVERRDGLLFYPVQYEGMEMSPNVVYLGAAPNQQVIPGTRWALRSLGPRVYYVGSDYVFPRAAGVIVADVVRSGGGTLLGERYVPFGSEDMGAVVADVRRLRPDVVLNTINGDGNRAFFAGLVNAGLGEVPVVSFSVTEREMVAFGGVALSRHYAVWSYFQSLPGLANRRFVAAFKARFGPDRVTNDPVLAAFTGVRLWAAAVREAGETAPERVGEAVLHQTMDGPAGVVALDRATRHAWRAVRVGKVRPDGQFDVVHAFPSLVRPNPFPTYRSRSEWRTLEAAVRGSGTP